MRVAQAVGRVLIVLLATVALALIVLLIVARTDWGRERVRLAILSQMKGRVHGQVHIGKVTGDLLGGMTLRDFSIADSTGKPFIAAEQVHVRYAALGFLSQRLWFDDVRLVHPVVVLDKQPGGLWNWQYIFPKDTSVRPTGPSAWTRSIRLTNVQLVDGRLVVRSPWHPSSRLSTQRAIDSAVTAVLSGQSRLMVQRVPGGFQKIVELRSITAQLPLVRLTDPAFNYRLARVSGLEMEAYPFRPPAARITAMRGDFLFTNDSVWWKGVQSQMPGSRISGDGRYLLNSGDMTLNLHGAPARAGDLRWLYPRLPADGYGTLDFALNWQGAAQDYIARNADVHFGQARARGSFGITLTDTFTIHHTDLRVSDLDTRLLEQLVPGFSVPRRGVVSGQAQVSGGKHALFVNGDVAFSAAGAGTSRVAAAGEVGFLSGGVRANRLRLRMHPLQVELLRTFASSLPVSGVIEGTATLDGSTSQQLAVTADIRHTDRGAVSHLAGDATVRLAGSTWIDVRARAEPLSLAEVGRFMPAVGLHGNVTGPIRLRGPLSNLRLDTQLRLPDGGQLAANGTIGVAGANTRYALAAGLRVVNLRSVVASAPRTSVTAQVQASGRGFNPRTMTTRLAIEASGSTWDSISVDTLSTRLAIAGGLMTVERAYVRSAHTSLNASGAFGLAPGRSGELAFRVAIDSLGAYNRWVPRTAGDTGAIPPRPARVAAAILRAQADSARLAQQTEVERAVTGAPMPRVRPNIPQPIRRDALSGKLAAAGTIRGNVSDFDLRARVAGENLVVRGNSASTLRADVAWTNARTPRARLALAAQAADLSAYGFAFDSIDTRLAWASPDGHVELVARQGTNRDYEVRGDFTLRPDARELRIADLSLRMDTTRLATTRPAVVHWSSQGISVHNLEIVDQRGGRIFADGLLPTQGVASFRLDVRGLDVANVAELLQSDLAVSGILSLSGSMDGTLQDPRYHAAFALANGVYDGTHLPLLRGTMDYRDRALATHVDALRDTGGTLAVADAHLPVNLALSGVTGSRLLDAPLSADVLADSLPLDMVPTFTGAISEVGGLAIGRFSLRGTLRQPALVGALAIAGGHVRITALGTRIADINGAVRMLNDTVYVDSLVGRSKGPVRIRGTLGVGSWREPTFDLYLVADDAVILDSDRGRLLADAGLALKGPFRMAYLSGQVTITQGVVYTTGMASSRRVISAGDPTIFNVLDTALVSETELVPVSNPLLRTLRADVAIAVHRNTWVRSREANIEVFTEYPVSVHVANEEVSLLGSVATERGEYSFLSKRFQIKRGSAVFVGSPEINPLLQITGEYEVRIPGQPALNIEVVIGGTLKNPTLTLESDAQPPKSQAELLSYMAFGRSTTSLLDFGASSASTIASSGDLVGFGAQLAVRRLASVALGVAADELESEAGRALGTDVFNITPADVPVDLVRGRGVTDFLRQTRVEAGKYLNPRTFMALQSVAQYPGLRLEYRTPKGWRYEVSSEPRLLAREPSLGGGASAAPISAFGAFIVREWRF